MKKYFYGIFVLLVLGLFLISGCAKTEVGQKINGITPEVEGDDPSYGCSVSGCSGTPSSASITCTGPNVIGCICDCSGPEKSADCDCMGTAKRS